MSQRKCKCGKPAVFYRRYEGTYLCKTCFCRSVEKKVKKNIRVHNLIKSGDRIGVALSGGKDSTTVLYIMHKIVHPRRDMELAAISIDEGIKGYREKALKQAEKTCKKLGVKHYVFSFKEEFGKTLDEKIKDIKSGRFKPDVDVACTLCGVGRRYILNKKARELKLTKICLGHNLDDEVQGILMNYIRGDLPRASRMGPEPVVYDKKFIGRIKPLRVIPEKESALYAILKGLDFYNKHCPYRSGMRLEVRDFINSLEANHSGIKFNILETFDRVLPSIRRLVESEIENVTYCKKCGEPASKDICKACDLWGK